jgi:hypothetical protein
MVDNATWSLAFNAVFNALSMFSRIFRATPYTKQFAHKSMPEPRLLRYYLQSCKPWRGMLDHLKVVSYLDTRL